MPAIPNFVLKRLYVKGSLVNTPDGCEIQLRNFVGSGTLTGLLSVDVDGKTFPTDALSVALPDGGIRSGESVIPTAPLVLASGSCRRHTSSWRAIGGGKPRAEGPNPHGRNGTAGHRFVGCGSGETSGRAGRTLRGRPRAAQAASPAGAISRPLKVAIIGAGSAVFARELMADMVSSPVCFGHFCAGRHRRGTS